MQSWITFSALSTLKSLLSVAKQPFCDFIYTKERAYIFIRKKKQQQQDHYFIIPTTKQIIIYFILLE